MARFNTEAIVLKSIKIKDTDKIYTLFTKDKGKISVLAKGVRKITSRRSGNLDTLNYVDAQLSDGLGDLHYINEVKTIDAFINIKKEYYLSRQAFYAIELIDKSLHADESTQDIFSLLITLLHRLNTPDITEPIALKYVNGFELLLMKKLGYSPPASFLNLLRTSTTSSDYITADRLIKQYVQESLGEKFESLRI